MYNYNYRVAWKNTPSSQVCYGPWVGNPVELWELFRYVTMIQGSFNGEIPQLWFERKNLDVKDEPLYVMKPHLGLNQSEDLSSRMNVETDCNVCLLFKSIVTKFIIIERVAIQNLNSNSNSNVAEKKHSQSDNEKSFPEVKKIRFDNNDISVKMDFQ